MSVRVRFAPSPTGNVHIGNIRAAIFNWLFARHHGGAFLLRVEDTDRERSTPEAIRTLLECMDWLGLNFDETPLYQSAQTAHHLAMAEDLVRRGLAYREDKGGTGKGECIVFRTSVDGEIAFDDLVKGRMAKQAADVADFVIVRSDGTPVFHLANVLDDIAQKVTHIIRGDDHVENTFKHVELFRAFGHEPPLYAHLPMIVNAQGKPYSKRDGAAFVGEYQQQGYLPEALFNFLALLGWSPGEDREVMTREEMVQLFELDRVKSNPAQFDLKKLLWMNGEHIRRLPLETFRAQFLAETRAAGYAVDACEPAFVDALIAQIQPRTKLYSEIAPATLYFFTEEYPFDDKAVRKRLLKDGVAELLEAVTAPLESAEAFDAVSLEASLRGFCETRGQEFSTLVHPLRVAVSGRGEGPGLFELLALLGRDRCIERLRKVVSRLRGNGFSPA